MGYVEDFSVRFWRKVDKTGDCWLWTAQTMQRGGYGIASFRVNGDGQRQRGVPAHRAAWFLHHGAWPADDVVLAHACGNHLCVRVDHLSPVPVGRTLADRYWLKVDKHGENGCWRWLGSKSDFGYGRLLHTHAAGLAAYTTAHRASWEIHAGPVPDGLLVLHRCDNAECSNPAHLFLGTARDNSEDMAAKGRGGRTKVAPQDVLPIVEKHAEGRTPTALATEYGVTVGAIYHLLNGRTWSHVTGLTRRRCSGG
jgi:hypothetical protein